MANQPHPTPPQPQPPPSPPPPKPNGDEDPQAPKTDAEARERLYKIDKHGVSMRDAQADPFLAGEKTVQQEQIERSHEIEATGVEKWKAEHNPKADEKTDEKADKPKSPPPKG